MDPSVLALVSSFVGDKLNTDQKSGTNDSERGNSHRNNDGIHQTISAETLSVTDTEDGRIESVRVVIFSKDRPWQLQQLLRSMRLRHGPQNSDKEQAYQSRPVSVEIFLLSCVQEPFRDGYHNVQKKFRHETSTIDWISGLRCLEESPPNTASGIASFPELLHQAMYGTDPKSNNNDSASTTAVWFLTDDMLMLSPLHVIVSTGVTVLNNGIDGFLPRLHPGICWSQTRQIVSLPPSTALRYVQGQNSNATIDDILSWTLPTRAARTGSTTHATATTTRYGPDWTYPFDLSGGLYRQSFLSQHLEDRTTNPQGWSHPNHFETFGNSCFNKTDYGIRLAMPTRPMLLLLAINRVQTVHRAPLAIPMDDSETNVDDLSPEALLSYLQQNRHLNLEAYQSRIFRASHIGNIWLENDNSNNNSHHDQQAQKDYSPKGTVHNNNDDEPSVDVSVLIPVHTGPPNYARQAMVSVVMQLVESINDKTSSSSLSSLQVVLVNDRCSDGSIHAMIRVAETLAQTHGISYETVHHRDGPTCAANDTLLVPTTNSNTPDSHSHSDPLHRRLRLDVCSSPKPGVAAALNYGWAFCRAPFIARMDADDVCAPGRLSAQVEYLHTHPHVVVAGTHSVVFRTMTTSVLDTNSSNKRITACRDLPYSDILRQLETQKDMQSGLEDNHDDIKSNDEDSAFHYAARPSLPPCSPRFKAWCMLFSCCMSHPSVMIRKQALAKRLSTVYDESIQHAEDYELWLRLLYSTIPNQELTSTHTSSLVSIPRIGVWHRKHQQASVDGSSKRRKQKDSSLRVSQAAMQRLLSSHGSTERKLSIEVVSLLVTNGSLETDATSLLLHHFNSASELLLDLQKAFLRLHDKKNGSEEATTTSPDAALVRYDVKERLGELAVQAFRIHGKERVQKSLVWRLWCQHCQDRVLEQVALLAS